MWIRLPLALAAACIAVIPATSAAAAAPAADTAPPVLVSLAVSQASVTVSGLETVMVTVTAHFTDETGVVPVGTGPDGYRPFVSFYQGPVPTQPPAEAYLKLTDGTERDGMWTGQVAITSAWSGVIVAAYLGAIDKSSNQLEGETADMIGQPPTITVISSHRPTLSQTFSPEPATKGRAVKQTVHAVDASTGLPWARLPLVIATGDGCSRYSGVRTAVRTDVNGNYQRTVTADLAYRCAFVVGRQPAGMTWPLTVIHSVEAQIRYRKYAVGAAPAATSVPYGTNVNVNGNLVPPTYFKAIHLQRLYGGGVWRTVNTATVRQSGRFTVVATVPGKATYSYRVWVPGDLNVVGTVSKVFKIRGS